LAAWLLACIRRLLPPLPTVKVMPLDRIKITYFDQTPKRLARRLAAFWRPYVKIRLNFRKLP
jgi:hypothetical protein